MTRPSFAPTKDYLCNFFINSIPLVKLRMAAYRMLGITIGAGTTILMRTEVHCGIQMTIGRHTVINQHCLLDGRGGLSIGDNVNISSHVLLVAGSHDVNDGVEFGGGDAGQI